MTLGTLLYVLYTAAGLALLPISFIKSAPSVSAPSLAATSAAALEANRERQRQLQGRNAGRAGGLTANDRRELEGLVREERTLQRRVRLAAEARGEGEGWVVKTWTKLEAVFRPVKLLGGVFLLLLAVLMWVSMLLTGIDKAGNSVCGRRCGYVLGRINIFNPVNWVLVQSARAFPVDYVVVALLVLFLFSASVAGVARVGVRFLWVRVFQVRKGHTSPQALLVATVMLALMVLAINYALTMMVAPQYATFGPQTFCDGGRAAGEALDCADHPELVRPCSERSKTPASGDVCTPSVVSTFINRVTLNFPFLGAVDFWAQFAFLGECAACVTPCADLTSDSGVPGGAGDGAGAHAGARRRPAGRGRRGRRGGGPARQHGPQVRRHLAGHHGARWPGAGRAARRGGAWGARRRRARRLRTGGTSRRPPWPQPGTVSTGTEQGACAMYTSDGARAGLGRRGGWVVSGLRL